MWIFIKCYGSLAFFLYMGYVIYTEEHKTTPEPTTKTEQPGSLAQHPPFTAGDYQAAGSQERLTLSYERGQAVLIRKGELQYIICRQGQYYVGLTSDRITRIGKAELLIDGQGSYTLMDR